MDKINQGMDKMVTLIGSMLQAPEERRRPGMASVQMEEETSFQKPDASTDGVTKDTLSTRTQSLYPRQVGEQQDTGHHEVERMLYQFLGLALGTMRWDRLPVVSPLGRRLCMRQIPMPSKHKQHQSMTLPKIE